MLAYGYEWDSRAERPLSLREASLACTRQELDNLIAMLQVFRDRMPQEAEGGHQHFRDWSKGWDRGHSDFIVIASDQPWTKEN